jgi:adenosylcobinamide-GDP ribazoletransferase
MWASFVFALQFLTRIHIADPAWDYEKCGRGSAFFPVVGLVVGGFLVVLKILGALYFSPLIMAALILVGEVLITGGLHVDGFMDSIDGLYSGRERERKLEIMKDSRVGSFGALGLACLILIKYVFYLELLKTGQIGWLLAIPVFGRWCMVYALRYFPYLRQQGLGNPYSDHTGNREFVIATTVLAGTLVLALREGAAAFLIPVLLMHLWLKQVHRVLGGLTGDIYGAAEEISEVVGLVTIYLVYIK